MKYVNDYLIPALTSLVILVCLSACSKMDRYNDGPISTDMTKPGVVTNVNVTNFNGGAKISYSLPKSSNILYVLAEYSIKEGKKIQTKSSYISDTITVDGFKDVGEYSISLFVVSRAEVKSDPVEVKVNPKMPVYKLVRPTIKVEEDFGGVYITATNTCKQAVGLILLTRNKETNKFQIYDQHYTAFEKIGYNIRGFDTTTQEFAIYITDQWGNFSDTLMKPIKPWPETKLDKSKFYVLPYTTNSQLYDDPGTRAWWGNIKYLFDSDMGTGWHTAGDHTVPAICSFGLGVTAQLSRFTLYNRPGDYSYSHGNPKVFTLWGTNDANPQDINLPKTSNEGDNVGGWINLGNYRFPDPPSGSLPTAATDADKQFVKDGVDFSIRRDAPTVNKLRIAVAETWGNGVNAHIVEIVIYGQIR